MIASLIILVLIVLILVFLFLRFTKSSNQKTSEPNPIKQFFQYLLLFGLLIIVGVGFSGLLARAVNQSSFFVADQAALARYTAFIVVGLPILFGLSWWIRNQHKNDSGQKNSTAWNFYLTIVLVTSVLVVVGALNQLLRWTFGTAEFSSQSLAQFLIWGIIWLLHLYLAKKFANLEKMQLHYLIGSFIGLILGIVGLSTLISTAVRSFLISQNSTLINTNLISLTNGLIYLFLAVLVWSIYWLRNAIKFEKSDIWLFYVLIIAIGGSLVTAISTFSTVLYQALVWFIGNPNEKVALIHFQDIPILVALAMSTVLVWWYHKSLLQQEKVQARTEIDRSYDYLISAIGLIAAAAGFTVIFVSLIESLSVSTIVVGSGAINTLLLALTLIAVGAPVWFIHWDRTQKLVKNEDLPEQTSQIRKIYLFLLFGIGGVAAVISLITAVFFLFEDIFTTGASLETLRRMRFPLGILLSTAAIAGYHWLIFKGEKENLLAEVAGPKYIYLVSPNDEEISKWLKVNTKAKFKVWFDVDSQEPVFDRAKLINLLEMSNSKTVFITNEQGKLKLINVVD
jgi:hypothetical protein